VLADLAPRSCQSAVDMCCVAGDDAAVAGVDLNAVVCVASAAEGEAGGVAAAVVVVAVDVAAVVVVDAAAVVAAVAVAAAVGEVVDEASEGVWCWRC